jgi:hypothetical protein
MFKGALTIAGLNCSISKYGTASLSTCLTALELAGEQTIVWLACSSVHCNPLLSSFSDCFSDLTVLLPCSHLKHGMSKKYSSLANRRFFRIRELNFGAGSFSSKH